MTDIATGIQIRIDGKSFEARPGELVIDAAERAGVYIPRFCYHPRMTPVGMCRQCLVEIDTGRGPALQPSCMISCTPEMTVETGTPVTVKAQTGVLELLLVNHPLDCPVCDKGGECPLQDQAVSHGPGESRMVEEKRHYEKPIPVSDLVLLDRERCILCDRCTRFAKEVAGEPLIHFQDRGNQTQVNTFPDHPFASYYSGNTVQICPVGALTSSSYRFKARPWDLDHVESTCQGCSAGCRTVVDTSRDEVVRVNGLDVDAVNWGWMCDKGRYGFPAFDSQARLRTPLVEASNGELKPASWSEAVTKAAEVISLAVAEDGPQAVAVLGGTDFTNEDAYAWAKLIKGVIGSDNVDAQCGDGLPADAVFGLSRASIEELCAPGSTILWLGPDPREELAVVFLRLRQAVTQAGAKLVAVTPVGTSLDGLATVVLHPAPGDLPALVAALIGQEPTSVASVDQSAIARARALLSGDFNVAIGRSSAAESPDFVLEAAGQIRQARPAAKFLPLLRRGNVMGALDMGLSPGVLPGRSSLAAASDRIGVLWPKVAPTVGLDAEGILRAAVEGKIKTLVLLGADPLSDFPDRKLATAAMHNIEHVVSLDVFTRASSADATVVFPIAGPNETSGTVTNIEGRISPVRQATTPPGTARAAWAIAAELAFELGSDLGLESVADIWDEISSVALSHQGITPRMILDVEAGVIAPLPAETSPEQIVFTPPAPTPVPPLDSYALRLVLDRTLYDDAPATLNADPLSGLIDPAALRLNPSVMERLGVVDADTVRALSPRGSVEVVVRSDATVPTGVAAAAWRIDTPVRDLIDASVPVTEIRVETI